MNSIYLSSIMKLIYLNSLKSMERSIAEKSDKSKCKNIDKFCNIITLFTHKNKQPTHKNE